MRTQLHVEVPEELFVNFKVKLIRNRQVATKVIAELIELYLEEPEIKAEKSDQEPFDISELDKIKI